MFIIPLYGRVTSVFGDRINPKTDIREFHNGIDIEADYGANAKAVCGGVISRCGEDDLSGKYIVIKYGEYEVIYAHLSKTLYNTGDTVTRGDVIAETGNSGVSTGPHLHLGITKDGVYIDPLPYTALPLTEEVEREIMAGGEE